MSSLNRCSVSFLGVLGLLLVGGAATAEEAAPAPSTAEVLGKLHSTNVKEYRMGKMARDEGRSEDVKTFGQTLIDDHDDLDTMVVKVAKDEGITLAAHTPAVQMDKIPMGTAFDTAFAKTMAREHAKAIDELRGVLGSTQDQALKALIDRTLPVLERHESTAQQIVDQSRKS